MTEVEQAPPRVSVLMPTYDQEAFIARAVESMLAQRFASWELIVVDDGSPGDVPAALGAFSDPRMRYCREAENGGLGRALNRGLALARGELIAYLPSDDLFFADHLESLVAMLEEHPEAVGAYSGVRYRYNRYAPGQIDGYPLQLVQVMHRAMPSRWIERETLVTDDLGRLYWDALRERGELVNTGRVTCEWVHHAGQMHRILREPEGGVNSFRSRFHITHPLRFHSTVGNAIDEVAHYRRFRERPDTPPAADSLKIVLVGELAYNPERVLALEERGHTLYGLWMDRPYWYNSVGPVPFGHVEDLPREGWRDALRDIRPDVLYAQLNWQAVPFAHEVLRNNPGVPFVWHFKEGPFICLDRGTWPQLLDLYRHSDGQIYISPEMRDWFAGFLGPDMDPERTLVMDADLPKRDWFDVERSPRLSEHDGEVHTVVPGRPIGLHPHVVEALAQQGIHVHVYGDYTIGQWKEWIDKIAALPLAPRYLHLHGNVDQEDWVREFSQYDAGWLHYFESQNYGEIRRANWDDLNYPARLATLALAGLPILQADNSGHIVAAQRLAESLDIGLCFASLDDLGRRLRDRAEMERLRENVWRQRDRFTFDAHADRLLGFFRTVVERGRGP